MSWTAPPAQVRVTPNRANPGSTLRVSVRIDPSRGEPISAHVVALGEYRVDADVINLGSLPPVPTASGGVGVAAGGAESRAAASGARKVHSLADPPASKDTRRFMISDIVQLHPAHGDAGARLGKRRFDLVLPRGIPPSYTGRVASIRYEVRVSLVYASSARGGEKREIVVCTGFRVSEPIPAPGSTPGHEDAVVGSAPVLLSTHQARCALRPRRVVSHRRAGPHSGTRDRIAYSPAVQRSAGGPGGSIGVDGDRRGSGFRGPKVSPSPPSHTSGGGGKAHTPHPLREGETADHAVDGSGSYSTDSDGTEDSGSCSSESTASTGDAPSDDDGGGLGDGDTDADGGTVLDPRRTDPRGRAAADHGHHRHHHPRHHNHHHASETNHLSHDGRNQGHRRPRHRHRHHRRHGHHRTSRVTDGPQPQDTSAPAIPHLRHFNVTAPEGRVATFTLRYPRNDTPLRLGDTLPCVIDLSARTVPCEIVAIALSCRETVDIATVHDPSDPAHEQRACASGTRVVASEKLMWTESIDAAHTVTTCVEVHVPAMGAAASFATDLVAVTWALKVTFVIIVASKRRELDLELPLHVCV